ncbi:MAG: CHAT domain-containing protein, partial [Candidatus Dadabacteria bacterium]|nr:CHAT domain-containing protein [Candidatus Dadabacteria bacterium]
IQSKIEDFATVLMGAGSGRTIESTLKNLITGFVRGILDADKDYKFRSITLCEMDINRYNEMKRALYQLSSTKLFEEVEVTFYETKLPAPLTVSKRDRVQEGAPDFAYLIVTQQAKSNNSIDFRSSVLTSGSKATVVTEIKSVDTKELAKQLDLIEKSSFEFTSIPRYGKDLSNLVLSDRVLAILPTMREKHLIVVHDAEASRIPWETIHIDNWSPGAGAGITRKYIAQNLSVAKWLEQRRYGTTIDILLVVNPTLDLEGADKEGKRIRRLFEGNPSVNIVELHGEQAKKNVLKDAFRSGDYDVIHYAGHAFFDPNNPARSGILCNGGEVLSGSELAGLENLPSLVFFNACEAARIRNAKQLKNPKLNVNKRIERNVGLAEAFLRGGVANYIGTYWPVGDEAAKRFAESFYMSLLSGDPIGKAVAKGRSDLLEMGSVDWADYVHYGSYNFVLKRL